MHYGTCTYLMDLILVLQNLFLYFGSHTGAKVPVGTISRNKSESYHIQGQIRLMQIHIRYGHLSIAGTDHNRYIYRIHTDSKHIQKKIDYRFIS